MYINDLEDELEEKGYSCGKSFHNNSDAKEYAKTLRSQGKRARVVKYTTSVRGWYDYCVWYKDKED